MTIFTVLNRGVTVQYYIYSIFLCTVTPRFKTVKYVKNMVILGKIRDFLDIFFENAKFLKKKMMMRDFSKNLRFNYKKI